MRACILLAEPLPAVGERRRGRPSRHLLDRQLDVEDALLRLGREAALLPETEAIALVLGGEQLAGTARHALSAGLETHRAQISDMGSWSERDAVLLAAQAICHLEADLVIVGVDGACSWAPLAGQIAEAASMGLCGSMLRLRGVEGDSLLAEHRFEEEPEDVVLRHSLPLVSTVAEQGLALLPSLGYEDVLSARGHAIAAVSLDALRFDVTQVVARPHAGPPQPRLRRQATADERDGVLVAVEFLQVIGAVR